MMHESKTQSNTSLNTKAGQDISLVGAGICGLCTALALEKQGHQVNIYERDAPPPEGEIADAFFDWDRSGAAQFRHPHAFLAAICHLLEASYPDLIPRFIAAGGRKFTFAEMLPLELRKHYVPAAGDEDLWLLLCRRATMERVLRAYVEQHPNISIFPNTRITGIDTKHAGEHLSVTGLYVTELYIEGVQQEQGKGEKGKKGEKKAQAQLHPTDLVVDASGRTSRFQGWLEAAGAEITVEDDDAELVYYTRNYALKPGEQEPPRTGKERTAGDLGYLKYGVFPGDNGHFAVILCLPNHETALKQAVRNPDKFDRISSAIPGVAPWVSKSKAQPTTPPYGFGDIHAVWKSFVKAGRPQALNYFAVGDSAIRTNPLYGRGCSTGIMHAQLLAEVLAASDDPVERALSFDRKTEAMLRPIFKASLAEDRRGIGRARAIAAVADAGDAAKTNRLKSWLRNSLGEALAAASREQLHVFRGLMRSFNLMEQPGDFLKENRVRWTLLRYFLRGRKRNASLRLQHGPDRQSMLKVISPCFLEQPNRVP